MKTIKFFAAALAIVAAASCSKEPISNDNSDNTEPVLVHKVFTASLETDSDPDSKTTLHTDGKSVHWTAGDQIMLISATSDYVQSFSIIDESIDGTFADFEGETVDADSYRAVYPANAYKSSASTAEVFGIWSSVLSKQYVVSGNFSQGNRANCPNTNIAISTSSKDNHLYFKNINAYLKFRLNRNDVYSIEVSSDAVTYDSEGALSENADLGSTIRYVSATGHTYLEENVPIEVYGQDNLALAAGVDYYIAIPAVEIEGLTIKVRGSGFSELFTNKKQSTFKAEPNTIYDLGTLEYVAPPVVEPSIGDYYYTDGTYSAELDDSKYIAGVVFYVGDPREHDTTLGKVYPASCNRGLVLGLTEICGNLCSSNVSFLDYANTYGYMNPVGCAYSSSATSAVENGELCIGFNNTKVLSGCVKDNNLTSGALNGLKDLTTNIVGASEWFLPSYGEMLQIKKNAALLNDRIGDKGTKLQSRDYFTVSEEQGSSSYVGTINPITGRQHDACRTYSNYYIRPIFAF